jgi:hypothetical protein
MTALVLKYGVTTSRASGDYHFHKRGSLNSSFSVVTADITIMFNEDGRGTPKDFYIKRKELLEYKKASNPCHENHRTDGDSFYSAEIREVEFELAMAATVRRGDGIVDVTPDGIKAAERLLRRKVSKRQLKAA